MSFRQIRKQPGMDNIVKDLAEKLQRALADQGVEDVTLFRQNRVDYDAIAFTDTGGELGAGLQESNIDAIAFTDTETVLLQDSGEFQWTAATGDATQPLIWGFGDFARAA